MPKIDEERFRLETIDVDDVYAAAKERGWKEDHDSLLDCVDANDAAEHTCYKTLDEAAAAGRAFVKTKRAFFGCVIIDHQVYEAPHDDRGRSVRGPGSWETNCTYEIAMDGEMIVVES